MKLLILVLLSSFAFAQEESIYPSNLKLREDRKVGAGVTVGGPAGALGALVELNIEEDNGALAGFGSGSGYQSFFLGWKRSLEGEFFTPYTSLGYARWWNSNKNTDTGDSSLLRNFLTNKEKRNGTFGLDLVFGSIGMQFNQLSGEYAGSSFFIEFGGLLALDRSELMPTGSVGALYYF